MSSDVLPMNSDESQAADTPKPTSWWARYRLPIILAVIAVSFYVVSIVSIMYGRGGA